MLQHELDVNGSVMKPRRRARFLRGGVSLLSGVAFVVLVLGKKSALARKPVWARCAASDSGVISC